MRPLANFKATCGHVWGRPCWPLHREGWSGEGGRKEKNLELKSGGREGDRRRYKRRRRRRAKDCYTDRTQKRKTFKIYARVKKKIEIKKKVRKTGGGGKKESFFFVSLLPSFLPTLFSTI